MPIKQGGFKRKSKTSEEIPSSSLADIAFLLLIFFMVTTVFRTTSERPIEWPEAEAAQKIDEKADDILYVWLEQDGSIWVNDRPLAMTDLSGIVAPLYVQTNQRLVVSLRADRDVPYLYVDLLQKELQEGGAVRLVFATELERSMTRERR